MKYKIVYITVLLIGTGFVSPFLYEYFNSTQIVTAQFTSWCSGRLISEPTCGDNESCGIGYYTTHSPHGEGIFNIDLERVACVGTTCEDLWNISYATESSAICCDRDGDNFPFNHPGCPFTPTPDCDDDDPLVGYPCPTPTPTPCDGVCSEFGFDWFWGQDGSVCRPNVRHAT